MALANTAAVPAADMQKALATNVMAYQMVGNGVFRSLMIVRITQRPIKGAAIGRTPIYVGIESVEHVPEQSAVNVYGAAANKMVMIEVIVNIAALELLPGKLGHVQTPENVNGDAVKTTDMTMAGRNTAPPTNSQLGKNGRNL